MKVLTILVAVFWVAVGSAGLIGGVIPLFGDVNPPRTFDEDLAILQSQFSVRWPAIFPLLVRGILLRRMNNGSFRRREQETPEKPY